MNGITLDLYFGADQFRRFQEGEESYACTYEANGAGKIKVTADIDAVDVLNDRVTPQDWGKARNRVVNVIVRRKRRLA